MRLCAPERQTEEREQIRIMIRRGFLLGLGFGSLVLLTIACASSESGDPQDEGEESDEQNLTNVRKRTVCFSGASFDSNPYSSQGNAELAQLCESMPGLIRGSSYPFFTWQESGSLKAVVKALDTNGDQKFTAADEPVELTIIGFSWGGFNAVALAREMQTTNLIVTNRRKAVAKVFALDPYTRPGFLMEASQLVVPSNVQRFWEFRHTVAPPSDCSTNAPAGPYRGIEPSCSRVTKCVDYDFSLAPNDVFSGVRGRDVGHCTLPMITTRIIREMNEKNETSEPLPPTRPVKAH
jgi:hypothetical protein